MAKNPEPLFQRSKDIIISSIISIAITIVFGYYFLYIGNRERKPTFYLDPTRTTILDKSNAANAPLLLLKSNGDTILADVTSVYFYFFNQGEETIKQENIYAPLKIVMSDSAEILDFKILKVARPVSGMQLARDAAATLATFAGVGLGGLSTSVAAHGDDPAKPLIGFTSVAANTLPLTDAVTVPQGYTARVMVAWGDALSFGSHWNPSTEMTEAVQLRTYGAHTDGMHFFPFSNSERVGSKHGLLVANHEYNDPGLVHGTLTYTTDAMTAERVGTQLAAHGVSVVELIKPYRRGDWEVKRPSRFARRITGNTPMKISGPAAGHAMLKTDADPTGMRVLGTLNNCAHGYTPWGTYLTCEENWNGYFGTKEATLLQTPHEKRYGVTKTGFGYRWYEANDRFDVRVNSNEPNRFGWVVEIDPFDPKSIPIKRTALGRVKHEGA